MVSHEPLLPSVGQSVAVSAIPDDPDGVPSATLHYRPDVGTWATAAMSADADGKFSASIPRQSSGAIVQFYVESMDSLGAWTTFPKEGPRSRTLFEVNDGVSENGVVYDLRAIMLREDSDHLHSRFNTLFNELLGAAVLYQNEVFYDVGIRLKGSFVGQDAARVGFSLKFNPDRLFRGIHEKIAFERSTHGDLGVDEVIIKHNATKAGGIPGMYDVLQFIAPCSEHNHRALVRIAGFDDIYLDSQFEDGSDGTLFEYEVYRWATTTADGTPEGVKRAEIIFRTAISTFPSEDMEMKRKTTVGTA